MKQLGFVLLVCSMLIMTGCTKPAQNADDTVATDTGTTDNADLNAGDDIVNEGENISVHYVGKLEDGTVFDTSKEDVAQENDLYNPQRPYTPLTFTVGAGQMIKGFDTGVVGMKIGETKTLTIPAEEGYGEINPDLIQEIPLSGFVAGGITPEVGEIYTVGFAQGKVLSIEGEVIEMDFNHFLAGQTLIFEVEVVTIN